jgi:hypothetical protein
MMPLLNHEDNLEEKGKVIREEQMGKGLHNEIQSRNESQKEKILLGIFFKDIVGTFPIQGLFYFKQEWKFWREDAIRKTPCMQK